MDYTKFYKSSFNPEREFNCPRYDLFLSAYDECDRTLIPYQKVQAKEKIWLLFPQYRYNGSVPTDGVYFNNGKSEAEYYRDFIKRYGNTLCGKSICVDSTGFLRPHLAFLVAYFNYIGVKQFDVLYTEPGMYSKADETSFSINIDCVRTVEGCTSNPIIAEEMNDVLIVCSGYDEKLFAAVASDKSNCKYKYHIIGFPSLQADMYQESMLRFYNIKESIGSSMRQFAPAFDPFVTAQTIDDIIKQIPNPTNIYLSPLSTKPQTLGMVLYYLYNKREKAINVLFPFCMEYTSGHTTGVKRTWRYTVELPESLR
jgi:hypothetical protein